MYIPTFSSYQMETTEGNASLSPWCCYFIVLPVIANCLYSWSPDGT